MHGSFKLLESLPLEHRSAAFAQSCIIIHCTTQLVLVSSKDTTELTALLPLPVQHSADLSCPLSMNIYSHNSDKQASSSCSSLITFSVLTVTCWLVLAQHRVLLIQHARCNHSSSTSSN
jgi:hypothetical protein